MTDDFSKQKIAQLSQPRTVYASQLALNAQTYLSAHERLENPTDLVNDIQISLSSDAQNAQKALELEQKKIISGLIRRRFVDTAIDIPNKTTRSIVEWYLMIPSDTFLKYVEWHKENGFSF